MPYCTNCGQDSPEGSNFCGNCGMPLRHLGHQGLLGTPEEPKAQDQVGAALPSSPTSASSQPQAGDPPTVISRTRPTGETTKALPAVAVEAELELLSPEDEAAVKALPSGSALLVVHRGPNAGSRILVNTDQVSAGRHQDSDIFLDDISVSRRHATFTRTPEGYVLSDRGSLNGTYVNRRLIDSTLLRHGDEVQIGKYRLLFFASPRDVS